jgi:hypothetical protein
MYVALRETFANPYDDAGEIDYETDAFIRESY